MKRSGKTVKIRTKRVVPMQPHLLPNQGILLHQLAVEKVEVKKGAKMRKICCQLLRSWGKSCGCGTPNIAPSRPTWKNWSNKRTFWWKSCLMSALQGSQSRQNWTKLCCWRSWTTTMTWLSRTNFLSKKVTRGPQFRPVSAPQSKSSTSRVWQCHTRLNMPKFGLKRCGREERHAKMKTYSNTIERVKRKVSIFLLDKITQKAPINLELTKKRQGVHNHKYYHFLYNLIKFKFFHLDRRLVLDS